MSNYKHQFLFGKKNYTIMLAGLGIMVLGFILMIGGGHAEDLTKVYPEDTLYGFQRTVLAPFLVLVGLATQAFAIFTKTDLPATIEDTPAEKRAARRTSASKRKTVTRK